jgi:LPXTG-motif cell wall-anchored protein
MYGAGPSASGGAALASTGLAAGSWVLGVVGLVFIALGLWALVRRHSKNRP